MRIVAGSLKGRRLKLASCSEVRPTSERVRESIFSVIGNYVIGTEAIDLFAGTGALGIEALSRGAKSVTFVEKDRALTKNLYSFCSSCGLLSQTAILNMDVVEAIKLLKRRDSKFDMILLDPPYNSDWIYN
ncbi:MAG: 16S rRNA (guanine(966)-N(2))-methyltransferase RsmD, partial [Pseudomonadota bacterium]